MLQHAAHVHVNMLQAFVLRLHSLLQVIEQPRVQCDHLVVPGPVQTACPEWLAPQWECKQLV